MATEVVIERETNLIPIPLPDETFRIVQYRPELAWILYAHLHYGQIGSPLNAKSVLHELCLMAALRYDQLKAAGPLTQHFRHWHPLICSTKAVVGSGKMQDERTASFVPPDWLTERRFC